MSLSDFQKICDDFGHDDEEDVIKISKYFHKTGVFTHFSEDISLMDNIFIDSQKLVDIVYKLLNSEVARIKMGKLNKEDVYKIWDKKKKLSIPKWISLVGKFGIMYQANENLFIIPEHLSRKKPYPKWQYDNDSNILQFRYSFDEYQPRGLMSRLIVELQ